jgi:hypothetical protein
MDIFIYEGFNMKKADSIFVKKYFEGYFSIYVYSIRKDFQLNIVPIAQNLRTKYNQIYGTETYKYEKESKINYTCHPEIIIEHLRKLHDKGFNEFHIEPDFLKITNFNSIEELLEYRCQI